MFHSVHCLQQIACRFYGGGTIFLVGMLLGTHCHYFPLDYLSFCLTGSKFDEMDPPGLTSPQSLKLTMVSSFDDHFPSHSQCNSVRGGIIYGVGAQSSRDLLYDQLHRRVWCELLLRGQPRLRRGDFTRQRSAPQFLFLIVLLLTILSLWY